MRWITIALAKELVPSGFFYLAEVCITLRVARERLEPCFIELIFNAVFQGCRAYVGGSDFQANITISAENTNGSVKGAEVLFELLFQFNLYAGEIPPLHCLFAYELQPFYVVIIRNTTIPKTFGKAP